MFIMKQINSLEFKKWLSNFLLIFAGIVVYAIVINAGAIFLALDRFVGYMSPFIAGAIIAYILNIPCSKIEKRLMLRKNKFIVKKARGISVLFTFLITIILIVVVMCMVIPQIVESTVDFVQAFPSYYSNAVDLITHLNNGGLGDLGLESSIEEMLIAALDGFQTKLINTFDFDFLWRSLLKVLNVSTYLINVTLAIISSVYLLLDPTSIKRFCLKVIYAFLPEKTSVVLVKYLRNTDIYFKRFLLCNTIDGIIVGIASVVGLSIINVKYSFALGVLEGVTNLIPYFGAIFGSLLVVIIVLLTVGPGKALIVGIFLFVLQQIDGQIIKPKLFGDSFNISPFVVIVSITLGGLYYGILGIVIAIPLVAIIKNIIEDILEYQIRKKKKKIVDNNASN